MSVTSGPINEAEQAGEKLADHIASRIPTLSALLQVLAGQELVIRISLEPKQ